MANWKRKYLVTGLITCMFFVLAGCGIREEKTEKVEELEYSIVEEEDIPKELQETIEEKKAAEFKLTYETKGMLYVVHGYGEQETGGYSIAVKNFYLTENAIYFDTELIGPAKNEHQSKSPSFPYIVLKTESRNKNVIFD